MKNCSKCGIEKDLTDFSKNKKKKDGYSFWCKECHEEYKKKHYLENKEKYLDKNKKHHLKMKAWLKELKQSLKCSECPEDHIACLDFHHESNKEMSVSKALNYGWGKDRILKEIAKCKVLCSNCHRKFHWSNNYENLDRSSSG